MLWMWKTYLEAIAAPIAVVSAAEAFGTRLARTARSTPKLVSAPPGHHLLALLRIVCSRKNFEAIYSQIIADERDQYFDALGSKAVWTARFCRVRMFVSVAHAMSLEKVLRLILKATGWWGH
jgi:hypothetical protein